MVLQAAFLRAKLPVLDRMNERRRDIAKAYINGINNPKIMLPYVINDVVPVWHIFAIRCRERDKLSGYLGEFGIKTNKHYPIPIHLQECYDNLCFNKGDFPIAEEISSTELSLPMYYGLSDEEIDFIIDKLNKF